MDAGASVSLRWDAKNRAVLKLEYCIKQQANDAYSKHHDADESVNRVLHLAPIHLWWDEWCRIYTMNILAKRRTLTRGQRKVGLVLGGTMSSGPASRGRIAGQDIQYQDNRISQMRKTALLRKCELQALGSELGEE